MTKQYSMSCSKYTGEGKVNFVTALASSETLTSEGSKIAVPNGMISADG